MPLELVAEQLRLIEVTATSICDIYIYMYEHVLHAVCCMWDVWREEKKGVNMNQNYLNVSSFRID